MGYHAVRQVLETTPSEIKGPARMVLVALAHHADDATLVAYPSIPLLMWETALGKTSVHAALNRLETAGAITRITRRGRKSTNLYQLEVLTRPEPHPTKQRGEARYYQQRLALKRKNAQKNGEIERKRSPVRTIYQNGKRSPVRTQNVHTSEPLNVHTSEPNQSEEYSGNNGAMSLKEGLERFGLYRRTPDSNAESDDR